MNDKEFIEVPIAPLKTVASKELSEIVEDELLVEDPVDKSVAQQLINDNTNEAGK